MNRPPVPPFMSEWRRLLYLYFKYGRGSTSPRPTQLLINEDHDYIVIGEDRILIKEGSVMASQFLVDEAGDYILFGEDRIFLRRVRTS